MDARICPDGSAVGRTGPKCEFASCPLAKPSFDKPVTMKGVTIVPKKVKEDSRCPVDVTCISAGTVKLQATITSQGKTEEVVLELGTPTTFMGRLVTLESVSPAAHSERQISQSDYSFTFSVN